MTITAAIAAGTCDAGRYSSYVAKNPHEQARSVKTVVSNSTFDGGNLCPTYVKPFDLFANGGKTGDWLAALNDFRNSLIREEA